MEVFFDRCWDVNCLDARTDHQAFLFSSWRNNHQHAGRKTVGYRTVGRTTSDSCLAMKIFNLRGLGIKGFPYRIRQFVCRGDR